ncbi:SUF system NifU family Fe-S cluster assembly protein, partial [Burkholderia thailandensis]|nr:SUF system NifU family Fe-S cluster assembly protein [Burkholderia thailandensis]
TNRIEWPGCHSSIASAPVRPEAVVGRATEAAGGQPGWCRTVTAGRAGHGEASIRKRSSLAAVQRYPSRSKCALLGWNALAHALDTRVAAPSDAEPSAS